ncbi:PREDICTED: uncharacterized protein LOC106809873 [Priapulus caudatus]|uniref:Uncharacterized protein LOC106809873 n=1 Tax=Priapulus caudatus TaxID=37621 RepID=A0ABM1E8S4_PRICU|nr:PREDICTED: uncharacterized protein LOC106809873 [Priapulus caudatus]
MKISLVVLVLLAGCVLHVSGQGFFNRFKTTTTPKPKPTRKPATLPKPAVPQSDFFSISENADRIKEFVQTIKTTTDLFTIDAHPENDEDVDILFLLDRSFSVTRDGFESAKCAIIQWVQLLDNDLNIRARVTIMSYGRIVTLDSPDFFETYRNVTQLTTAIEKLRYYKWTTNDLCPTRETPRGPIPYDGCATCTNLALDVAHWLLVGSGKSRPAATKGVLLLTDGQSNCPDSAASIAAAEPLKQAGVTLFVHGIGSMVDRDEVLAIASPGNVNFNSDYTATCDAATLAKERSAI